MWWSSTPSIPQSMRPPPAGDMVCFAGYWATTDLLSFLFVSLYIPRWRGLGCGNKILFLPSLKAVHIRFQHSSYVFNISQYFVIIKSKY